MIVSDVASRVRRIFGDEASVQITDSDIINWINDAQEDILLSNTELLETKATANVVSGQSDYSSPSDLNVLRSLSYQGFALKSMSFNEFNEYMNGFAAPSGLNPYGPGIPTCYTVYNNTITLFPTPSDNVTNGLTIFYIKHPVIVATMADTLTVPLQYHTSVVDYCLKQAYELDEDPGKSSLKEKQFATKLQKLNDRNKTISRDYYPGVTVEPEDTGYNEGYFGWGPY